MKFYLKIYNVYETEIIIFISVRPDLRANLVFRLNIKLLPSRSEFFRSDLSPAGYNEG